MFILPTFNARLRPCPVNAAAFTPHDQGQFCSQCQRVVQDFSQSIDPVADLAAARATAPDGRVCGSFGAAQVQRPRLTQRLRWFVVALVLVVGQGLTAREALAQVRRPPITSQKTAKPTETKQPATLVEVSVGMVLDGVDDSPELADKVYTFVEEMPQLPGGTRGNTAEIAAFIWKHTLIPTSMFHGDYPEKSRILYEFTVTETGEVSNACIIENINPNVDAAVLKAVYSLPRFLPGRQKGVPVKVRYRIPMNFEWR